MSTVKGCILPGRTTFRNWHDPDEPHQDSVGGFLRAYRVITMVDLEILDQQKAQMRFEYNRYVKRKYALLFVLLPLIVLLIFFAVTLGAADLTFGDIVSVIVAKISGRNTSGTDIADLIVWKLRFPRIVMGLIAGLALGSSGAVMQGVLKNPLADPYILGISSAAGFGASIAIIFGIGFFSGPYLIIGNAFIFSLLSVSLILLLSGSNKSSPQNMVLIGLALLFFFQAMTTILQFFGDADAVKSAVFWTVGDLGKSSWSKLAISAPLVLTGTFFLIWKARDLDIMNSGDSSAKSLGINVRTTRLSTMIVCALMVASVVSFTGTIGFIGLVAPHLVRLVIGSDTKILIPASGLVGAILLIASDSIARTIISPIILPVGSVTAFLGVPLFVYLIVRKKGNIL